MIPSAAGIHYLLFGLFIVLIDARFVSLQPFADVPLTINSISAEALPIVPVASSIMNQGDASSPTKTTLHANTTVCYPIVGCFDNNDPFDNAGLEVPQSPEFIDTQFLLFTQETPTNPEILRYSDNDQSMKESRVNSSRWLRIVVHGFVNNRDSYWIKPLKDELLKLQDNELSDVLVVDWGKGAEFPLYANAAANTRLVGKQIGIFLQKLQQFKQFSYDKVHCIGHSLGAHTCGLASNSINNQMARISGLDPAGPLFQSKNIAVRLDQSDAKFIDVIHSNGDAAFGLGLGSGESSGHVDFYANGGQHQPGCPSIVALLGNVIHGQSEDAFAQTSCSHSRSHEYYIESINSECPYNAFPCHDYGSFISGKCPSCSTTGCAQMGFNSIYSLGRGNMYLATKDASPFCGYHYLVEIKLAHDMINTGGEIHVAIHSKYEMLANVSMTAKSNAEIKAGDTLRHVFSYQVNFDHVNYVIVYFNKAKGFFGLGAPKGNDIVISRLRLTALEDTIVYSGLCQSNTKITAYTSETVLLNRSDCHD